MVPGFPVHKNVVTTSFSCASLAQEFLANSHENRRENKAQDFAWPRNFLGILHILSSQP